MQKDSLLGRIGAALFGGRSPEFRTFRDGMGNFEISVPARWKHDRDIAVVDGKYTVSFESPDGRSEFTVSVDAQLPPHFDFPAYAKSELESPESGIYTPVSKGEFRGMPAFWREYSYECGGMRYSGGGVMFHSGLLVFSLCWSAPEAAGMKAVFDRMLQSLSVGGRLSPPHENNAGAAASSPGRKKRRGK